MEIFQKYNTDVVRAEYRNVLPDSMLNLNAGNKKTTFRIDYNDNFATKKFQYFISGSYVQIDGNKYPAGSNVKLVDNFVPHLFTHIELRKHNKLLEEIDYPGICSTVKDTVGYSLYENGSSVISGFESRFSGGTYFSAVGYLSSLGLGFFTDVDVPIYRGGFELIFTRNYDEDALYLFKTKKQDGTFDDASLPSIGKIIINEFYIRVPVTTYEDTAKIQLVNELQTLSSKTQYLFRYKTWQCICQKNVSGKTLNFDITNIYRNVNNPLFGMVVFQTNRSNDLLKDPSIYDHCDVKNIWFEINGRRYPEEQMNLDWDEENWAVAYDMLQDYKRVFVKSHQELPFSYLTPTNFKDRRPIFVIDFSRQPWSNGKSNILLHVDFNKTVTTHTQNTEGTICYVVIVSNMVFAYDILNNTVKEQEL